MQTPVILVTARCRDNPECIFDGSDMLVETIVQNASTGAISVPVEFLKKQGAYCTLVDNESNRKISLRISAPPEALLDKITQIPSQGTFTITSVVTANSIYALRGTTVDLTATLGVSIPLHVSASEEPIFFEGTTTLRIRSKDTAEREKK